MEAEQINKVIAKLEALVEELTTKRNLYNNEPKCNLKNPECLEQWLAGAQKIWQEIGKKHAKLIEIGYASKETAKILKETYYYKKRLFSMAKLKHNDMVSNIKMRLGANHDENDSISSEDDSNDEDEIIRRFNIKIHAVSHKLDIAEEYIENDEEDMARRLLDDLKEEKNYFGTYMEELLVRDKTGKHKMSYDTLMTRYNEIQKKVGDETESHVKLGSLKLKPIEIPIFNGSIEEWKGFSGLFKVMIMNNDSLNDIQRLQYLKTRLIGEAAGMITNIKLEEGNFDKAWKLLVDRYENKRALRNSHLDELFNMEKMEAENASDLQKHHDLASICIHELKDIDAKQLILYLLERKLSNETRMEYEQSLKNPEDEQSLSAYMGFVKKRCLVLEFIKNDTKYDTKYDYESSENEFEENNYSSYLATVNENELHNETSNNNNNLTSILPTALIKIKTNDGWETVRALIDQCSMKSFINEKTVRRLKLKQTDHNNVNISGIAGCSETAKSTVELQIGAHYSTPFKINVKAFVLNKLATMLPSNDCDIEFIKNYKLANVMMADPNFNKRSSIDVCLGADVYSNLILDGIIRANDRSFLAQETNIGWIFSGTIPTNNQTNAVLTASNVNIKEKVKTKFKWNTRRNLFFFIIIAIFFLFGLISNFEMLCNYGALMDDAHELGPGKINSLEFKSLIQNTDHGQEVIGLTTNSCNRLNDMCTTIDIKTQAAYCAEAGKMSMVQP